MSHAPLALTTGERAASDVRSAVADLRVKAVAFCRAVSGDALDEQAAPRIGEPMPPPEAPPKPPGFIPGGRH